MRFVSYFAHVTLKDHFDGFVVRNGGGSVLRRHCEEQSLFVGLRTSQFVCVEKFERGGGRR